MTDRRRPADAPPPHTPSEQQSGNEGGASLPADQTASGGAMDVDPPADAAE